MKRCRFLLAFVCTMPVLSLFGAEKDRTHVLEPGKLPADARLGKLKTLNDYFPWTPPASKENWEKRRRELRAQILVATGLWPMPPATELNPVIHGKIERDGYTIEKVFFASYPGHYVSGNLYRPTGRNGKLPGVLCPHGHWPNGRFLDVQTGAHGAQDVEKQITSGAEKTVEGARFPLQARCASLARMGCVVFHYDMVGNADSQQIQHREGFTDAEAEQRLQSFMGLQTYNSVRSLDFLLSLPEVDSRRIGVTGASGGGTQTFILCAIDDRPTVAFPAVMVSTAMQGGCICENCSYLRQNTGNIEIAGLFAPRPLGMSAANDWTKEIETKGLPQLKELYWLYGVEDRVMAKAYLHFEHNYNQVSRELMYNWFNKHLDLGLPEPVVEKPFVPVPPKELSVYDAEHPRPADATDAAGLRKYMTQTSDKQLSEIRNKDPHGEFRRVLATALRVMAGGALPPSEGVEARAVGTDEAAQEIHWRKALLGRKGEGDQIPVVELRGAEFDGTVVVWIHPAGKASLLSGGELVPAARRILEKKAAIVAPDVLLTGESAGGKAPVVDPKYAGYTFGYNRPLLANRVQDILTTVAYAQRCAGVKKVDLVGFEAAGPWVLIARTLCGEKVARTALDGNQFSFEKVHATGDPMMLPGALKYGGLPAFASICAPNELFLHNASGVGTAVTAAYEAERATGNLQLMPGKATEDQVVDWLLR